MYTSNMQRNSHPLFYLKTGKYGHLHLLGEYMNFGMYIHTYKQLFFQCIFIQQYLIMKLWRETNMCIFSLIVNITLLFLPSETVLQTHQIYKVTPYTWTTYKLEHIQKWASMLAHMYTHTHTHAQISMHVCMDFIYIRTVNACRSAK